MSQPGQTSPPAGPALRVLAVTRKPDSPSFQHRVLDYIEPLRAEGIDVEWAPIPAGLAARRLLRRRMRAFDGVWWHKHLPNPLAVGLWHRSARRIVYDFDDPVMYSTHPGPFLPHLTRRLKFSRFLARCDAALAASEHLAGLARRWCPRSQVVPMAVEAPAQAPDRSARSGPVRLLWTGSRATLRFLRQALPALERLGRRDDVALRVLAHEPVRSAILNVDYRPWSPREEEAALRECDVGLCPMPDTLWTRGKCPYKVLRYMAWSMPWVGSAVGENQVAAGPEGSTEQRGVCVARPDGWADALRRLIDDPALRQTMGRQGRLYVERCHSPQVLTRLLAGLFREVFA